MIYKATDDKVFWTCGCGADHECSYSDLSADGVGDIFMKCDECGVPVTSCAVKILDEKSVGEDVRKRVVLNHTVYKRVLQFGKFVPRRGFETIDKALPVFQELALNDSVVEAPLHPAIARAKRIKEDPDYKEDSLEERIEKRKEELAKAKAEKEAKEKSEG